MINKLVQFSLNQRVLALLIAVGVLLWGAFSFTQLPIEAYPDVMNTQVQVITQWPGHAAEEVEKLITVPLETSLNGVPHLASLRSRSMFGLSVVYLGFEDGVDDFFARQQVNERVSSADIPTGVQPNLSPLASATGEIYRYTLTGDTLTNLRSLQDWTVTRELKSVPGVADITSFGGTIKQYQVQIDPAKLKAYDITLKNVTDAITGANANAGGNFVERGSEEYVVRGVGLLHNEKDLENVVINARGGLPLKVRDVATVRIGFQPRLGKVGWREGGTSHEDDHDDSVEGIILLRRGENPDSTLEALHKKIAQLNGGILPRGVKIATFVDRTNLVHTTSHTVEHNLIEGVLLVIAVLVFFLGNLRAAVIVALTIPFGLLFAFSGMNLIHVPANLLSLGAVDFGIIVNGSVILVENVYRHLAERHESESVMSSIVIAVREVGTEIVFTTLIIILGYLPLMTMQSVEKKMFAPMAYTIGLALIGSLIMAIIVTPALCYLLLRGKLKHGEGRINLWLKHHYGNALKGALQNPLPVLVLSAGLFFLSMIALPKLGTEFLPHMDEGNLWIRATMPPTISYSEAQKLMPKVREILAKYQPTKLVVSHLGRPDDGTDATGFYNSEFLVDLKPREEWQGFTSKPQLITQMSDELKEIPGVTFNFSQIIEDNVEEAVTGVKGELAVKLFGDDLQTLEKKADGIQKTLASIPGVVDLDTFKETGEPQITLNINRDKIARYGLNVQDVQDVIETAIGGKTFTQILEGERKYGVAVRLKPDARKNITAIEDVFVSTPDGQRIPLAQLGDIKVERGASFVYREGGHRFIAIKFGVRGRDIGSVVREAQALVSRQVSLPSGYYTVWGGEFESMQRALARLMIVVPLTLVLIFLVLFLLFNQVSRAVIVMLNVPLSLIGGIFALYFLHLHLSVAAAVGFIALFGVAVQNGVIMISHFDHLIGTEGLSLHQAVVEGAVTRLRPVLMTALLASIGLLPAAISTGIGSDTQKPLAIVIIGGLISATALTLFVLPVLYRLFVRSPEAASRTNPYATPAEEKSISATI